MRHGSWPLALGVVLLAGCSDSSDLPRHGSFRPPPTTSVPRADARAIDASTDSGGVDAMLDGPVGCAGNPGTITVSSTNIVGLAAGSPMSGEVVVQVQGCAGSCPSYLVTAGTWEDPALAAGASCDGPVGASGSLTIDLGNKLAPATPGAYQLIVAGRAGTTCPEVASASSAGAVYGDGNDITDWPVSGISGGSTCVDWLEAGQMVKVRVPAAVVDITVQ